MGVSSKLKGMSKRRRKIYLARLIRKTIGDRKIDAQLRGEICHTIIKKYLQPLERTPKIKTYTITGVIHV